MATKFITPSWRMPKNSNQSKASNYSLDFDGSTQFIDCGDVLALKNASVITWNCWVNFTTGASNIVFGKGAGTDVIQFYTWSASKGYFFLKTNNSGTTAIIDPFINGTAIVNTGEWNMFTIVFDGNETGNGRLKIYLNGGSSNIITGYSGTPPAALSTGSDSFYIGKGTNGNFDGKLSQFSIFDYALTGSAVTALYNNGIPANPLAVTTPPVAYYDLGQGSAYASGSAGIVEPNLAAATGSTVFDFDGVNDYIDIGNLQPSTTSLSISAWAYKPDTTQGSIIGNGASVDYGIFVYGGSLQFGLNAGGWTTITTTLPTNQWFHVLGTWDGSTMKLYVNGALASSTSKTGTITYTSNDTTIGKNSTLGGFEWNGKISNVALWGSDQSANKDNIYNNGTPLQSNIPQSGSLKAWYKLGLDTSTWFDKINNVTPLNEWWVGNSNSNYPTSAKFLGTSDQANYSSLVLPSMVDLGSDNWGISFWFNVDMYLPNTPRNIMGGSGIFQYLSIFGSGGLYAYIQATWTLISGGFVADKQWHHCVITNEAGSPGTLKVYIDDNLTYTNTAGSAGLLPAKFYSIGTYGGGTARPYGGFVSNVSLFNTNLDASAVTTLYNNGTPEVTPSNSPTNWWKLDNLTNGIQDAIGSGGTFTNTNTIVGKVPVAKNTGISSGMDTTNLVPSNLQKSIPYSGYSMYFDGNNEYINCTDNDAFTFGNGSSDSAFSVSTWINMGTVNDFVPIAKDSSGAREWTIRMVSSQFHFYLIDNSSGGYIGRRTNWSFEADKWYNIIATYDATEASSGVKLYVNASGSDSDDYESGTYTAMENTSAILSIGMQQNGTVALPGNISNTAIFNRVLTEDEAIRIYNGGSPGNLSSLSPNSWWSLGVDSYFNGSEWICPDLGSNTINGTSVNMESEDLKGFGPDSLANGTSTNLNLGSDLIGEAPGSTGNAISINMNSLARTGSTP